MQLVVPSAVRIAEAIDAIICTIHLRVSFFVISHLLSRLIAALESAASAGVLFRAAVVNVAVVVSRVLIRGILHSA